ncbi:MAG: holo-ACP synthase [Candidatus Zixiibacteriota bacterium]|nr:MAG: holo-ACP synthase [candidate division Zixibacteria bacterium]
MADAVGIDIVEIERISRAYRRFGDRFVGRILGPDEVGMMGSRADKIAYLAGRLAAKEATIKALGHYLTKRPPIRTLQIHKGRDGRPELSLPDEVRKLLPPVKCLVSISHERSNAVGLAIITEEK